jgi:hypothetical protein
MKGRTVNKNQNRTGGRGHGLSRAMVGVGVGALGRGLSHYLETEMMLSLRDKTRVRITAGPIAAVPAVSSTPSRSLGAFAKAQ